MNSRHFWPCCLAILGFWLMPATGAEQLDPQTLINKLRQGGKVWAEGEVDKGA